MQNIDHAPHPGAKKGFFVKALLRFYRSPLGAFYNYHAYRLQRFVRRLSKTVRPDDTLLDVGAGDCQYKPFFAGRCKYLSQDVGGKDKSFTYDQIDIRSEIYSIPLPDESVDIILCTQVLEHLKYPAQAVQEMFRLLKPGGKLYLTVPFASEEHMLPYDYFRYTRFSLDFLMREHGFNPLLIDPQGGRFITLGKGIKDLLPLLAIGRPNLQKIVYLIQAPVVVPMLFLLFLLDFADKNKHMTQNYDVIAEKIVPANQAAVPNPSL
jgi:SAM-dependent methyltransferase